MRFQKRFYSQQYILSMIEKAKSVMDKGGHLVYYYKSVKINSSFSSFQIIISNSTQFLLFNIFLTDIFIFCPTKLKKIFAKSRRKSLEHSIKCFSYNYMVANADKCQFTNKYFKKSEC